ncbi:MAG: translation elongation factor [Sulfolobaceae archaeon]|nr:translation elongation factor [Sulfolobaceae archaeon]
MYYGEIFAVIGSDEKERESIAEKLGKLHEKEKTRIYYRKHGEYIRSVLVPSQYPESILDTAESATLASTIILHLPVNLQWTDGELLLLANSVNTKKIIIVSQLQQEMINKLLKDVKLSVQPEILNEIVEPSNENVEDDLGIIYVDRVFTVKGVGTVVTGFTYTPVEVHEKLVALPYGKEVEVKSIQVLDEDQKEVKSGTRIGFALKNVKEEEVKDTYFLVKPEVKFAKEFEASFTKYPWSQATSMTHIIYYGNSFTGEIKEENDKTKVTLNNPIPIRAGKIPVINVNVKPGKPRVLGYLTL